MPNLTPREQQIAALVAEAKCDKEIAWILGITTATVKVYMSRLYRKFTPPAGNQRVALALYWTRQNG